MTWIGGLMKWPFGNGKEAALLEPGDANSTVADAAKSSGIPNVRLLNLSRSLVRHRLCEKHVGLQEEEGLASWRSPGAAAKSEWISQIRVVTGFSIYSKQESLHPNYWAQLALRNCLRQLYQDGLPGTGGRCEPGSRGVDDLGEPREVFSPA